jgi:sec-independent protein translocase protein TatC
MYTTICYFVIFIVVYIFKEDCYRFLAKPLYQLNQDGRFIYTHPAEAFLTYVKTTLYLALLLSLPVLLNQLWRFVAPALYQQEKRVFRYFVIASPMLFLMGVGLAYYGIIPLALEFFLDFEQQGHATSLDVTLETKLSDYTQFILHFMIGFGLCFQIPIALGLLLKANIINRDWLRKNRRYAIIISLMLAAVLSPPDIVTQIALAIPMLILYEATYFIFSKV